ncbi:amidohydrolase family protein, partial [Candidatus Bathyarchaeota archaeon]|nr:amidohydrolase family protein [Candidatus Bathyarchaeota archaeon]
MPTFKVFTGATLIDGTGAKPVKDASVIVEGDRVKAAGKGLDVPRGADVIDVGGRTVLPGLIDSHLHLCSSGDPDILRMINYPMGMLQLFGYRNALNELEAGFTTVRDMGAPHG